VPSAPARSTTWHATFRRSLHLFREFRLEQTDAERFYTALAADTVGQLSTFVDLDGAQLLDVGGGPGFFRDAFVEAGATYLALDSDVGELTGFGSSSTDSVIGSGMQLPFRDACVDVAFSSNVLEHVPDPWLMGSEMLRVTRPGGTVFISYGAWWGPWGGHETSPWHYLGGRFARRRYVRTHGHEPKNRFGESLFVMTVGSGVRWAASRPDAELVAVLPRYNPRWTWWLVRVPLVRELVTWNLVVVLRKR
jgi:SAM-dependent methyltransferase